MCESGFGTKPQLKAGGKGRGIKGENVSERMQDERKEQNVWREREREREMIGSDFYQLPRSSVVFLCGMIEQ